MNFIISKIRTTIFLLFILIISTQSNAQSTPIYTIPVVFHILHQGGVENISDAQVLDALSILNKDFQKQNADIISVVPAFTNNIADVQFQFSLAGKDPNGNCTNGIIRHFTSKTIWDASDFSYFSFSWPRANYLNIYIVKSMTAPSGAYTFFPGSAIPPAADAIVAIHTCCGSIGTANAANSRWLTQKVGHWFNLQHTWGLNNTLPTACGDDGVLDTPPTKGFLNCSLLNANVCNSTIEENVQNFMDASPCQCMFTNGQKARMHTCINSSISSRNNLSSPTNLSLTGITSSTNNCIPLVDILATPNNTICTNTPLSVIAFTSNANATSYSWTANNNAIIANPTINPTSVVLNSQGNSTITCIASNSNGAATATTVVYALNKTANINLANTESFEAIYMPPNWTIVNPNTPASSWSLTNVSASHGAQCMMVNAEDAPGGSVEILQSPSYDFLNNPGSMFTFKYAYARYSTTHNDVFKVQASKDCGSTWQDVYVPSMISMASGSGETTDLLFIPAAVLWKSYTLSTHPVFSPFLKESNVMLRFYFQEDVTGFGNRFYLDQINFEFPTGINELTQALRFNVYPNPTSGETTLSFTLSDEKEMSYSITDLNGKVIIKSTPSKIVPGHYQYSINQNNELSAGMYFIQLNLEGVVVAKKIIID